MRFLIFSLIVLSLNFVPTKHTAAQELNIFSRDNVLFLWPVKGVKIAPTQDEIVDRKTKVLTLKQIRSARSQGRVRIASIVADFSSIPRTYNLDSICVLTDLPPETSLTLM